MNDPATRRLFLALWPDEALRRALAEAYGPVAAIADGRAVPPANLHLTLEFLGAVPEAEREPLEALAASVPFPAVDLVLDGLAWWPRARTLVAVAGDVPDAFLGAQQLLRQLLKGRGFRVDSRPFRPHVTLARKVAQRPSLGPAPRVVWPVAEVALVESVTSPGGSRYTPLARWPGAARDGAFGAI